MGGWGCSERRERGAITVATVRWRGGGTVTTVFGHIYYGRYCEDGVYDVMDTFGEDESDEERAEEWRGCMDVKIVPEASCDVTTIYLFL